MIDDLLKKYDKEVKILKTLNDDNRFFLDKESYMCLYIHHSVGIEGNTFSPGETIQFLKSGKIFETKTLGEHNELLDLKEAFLLMEENIKKEIPLTESVLLDYHKELIKRSTPYEAGQFKKSSNAVITSTGETRFYPSPEKSKILFFEAVTTLINQEKAKVHPLLIASDIHYNLASSHSFGDGNGRLSRLAFEHVMAAHDLPSTFLKKSERNSYILCLEKSQSINDKNIFREYVINGCLNHLNSEIKQLDDVKKKTLIESQPSKISTIKKEKILKKNDSNKNNLKL